MSDLAKWLLETCACEPDAEQRHDGSWEGRIIQCANCAAAARLDELERENAELRELRRVSFMQMLAVLRQCSDRLEIFNSSFSDIDPLSDTIVQYRSDANDSFVLERRAALAGSGEK